MFYKNNYLLFEALNLDKILYEGYNYTLPVVYDYQEIYNNTNTITQNNLPLLLNEPQTFNNVLFNNDKTEIYLNLNKSV